MRLNKYNNIKYNPIGQMDGTILVLFFLYGLASQYILLSVLAGYVLVVILKTLWKPFVPPVILFFVGLQWLQVFASVWYADFMGMSIAELFGSKDVEFLFIMTFLQLLAIVSVLSRYLKVSHTPSVNKETLLKAAERLNTKNVVIGYFITAILLPLIPTLTGGNASLYQLMVSFGILKYMFVALLVFVLLLKGTQKNYLIIGILIFDFVLSFTSFFSDFKTLLVIIIIAYFTVNPTLKRGALLRMLPIVVLLLIVFSFWSSVKGGYRAYLNQGSGKQIQVVSNTQALSYIFAEASDFNFKAVRDGASILLSRVQYMERYTEVYNHVPSVIEHQGGDDLSSVIEFLLIPRFLNPNKGVKDASIRTSYYTGKKFSNASQGTSISMGYFCDLYIDFGLYLMFIPLMLIYVAIGYVYKKIITLRSYNIIIVYGVLIGFFLSLGAFESDSLFFLGKLRNNIAFMLIVYFAFFPQLHKLLVSKK